MIRIVFNAFCDNTSYITFRWSSHKDKEFSSRVSKEKSRIWRIWLIFPSDDCPPFEAPEIPTSLPQTAALRAPAGVALGRLSPPLTHTITCVPAFGLSVGGVLHTAAKATHCWK